MHKRDGNTKVNPNKWAFFGGMNESDEKPVETFIREIKEELGVVLQASEVIPLCDYLNTDRGMHRYSFYVMSDTRKEDMVLGEGADFDWVSLDNVFELDATQKTFDDLNTFLNLKKV